MNIATPIRQRITTLRSQLRERRQERAEHRALVRDLSGYRTPSEVDELLAVLEQQAGPEADQVRDIVLQNVRPTPPLFRAA